VRVVAATNKNLEEAVAAKQFRDDLYFRLSVFPVEIPPLRRRRGDILLLAEAFLDKYAREMGRKNLELGDAARQALMEHSWPGNVRELQNCLERAAILCDGREIRPEHLRLSDGGATGPALGDVLDLSGTLADVSRRAAARAEEEAIARAMADTGGDRAAAAERLGISLSTLARRVRGAAD
jgi:DNA-binding NtrC family response regulator